MKKLVVIILLCVVFVGIAHAQYKIVSSCIGSGGGIIKSGSFTIQGTIGQSITGIVSSSSGTQYIGFWYAANSIFDSTEPDNISDLNQNNFSIKNYPNPFSSSTTIVYNIHEPDFVKLHIRDPWGRNIKLVVNQLQEKGRHQVVLDASALPDGIYFYQLFVGDEQYTGKMICNKGSF